MLKFNREKLRDKIYACWMGKNIGGTIGGPFEGQTNINDCAGFSTKPGEVLPNDDLDLQLIWLKAMEDRGPDGVNAQVLGEYWLSYIGPHWNEYGVCKSNLHAGLPAPLSGEYNNLTWKHSNGAWIRTEIWASLYPGYVEKAIEYAFADACVDHGFGEGSYAAIFVAALESAAFIFSDIETLIKIGLSKIPEDCRVARSVNLVMDAYHSGKTWQETRELVVEDSKDLGWFQAPGNVGFVVLGLLYGEGDFKTSLLRAVNCGDDTDCTAATVGSILGIIGGTACLPADWTEHLGDAINQACLLNGHGAYPKTIGALTDAVMNMHQVTMFVPFNKFDYHESYCNVSVHGGEDDFEGLKPEDFYGRKFVKRNFGRADYCVMAQATFVEAKIEMPDGLDITENGTLKVKVTGKLRGEIGHQHCTVNWYLPEGWTVSGKKDIHIHRWNQNTEPCNVSEFVITAGEKISGMNHVVVEIQQVGRSESAFAAFNIMG